MGNVQVDLGLHDLLSVLDDKAYKNDLQMFSPLVYPMHAPIGTD